jgi:hypothetical protein
MRRLYLVVVLAVIIQACTGMPLGIFDSPTNTPVPPTAALPATFTPVDTSTPTITPTITSSPTIVHLPTWDPNQPTATFIPVPIFIGKFTATPLTPIPTLTPVRPGPGFLSVEVTEKRLYWGSCKPNKTRIITTVENPEDVFSVIIFVQVKAANKEDSTPWTTGNSMQNHGNGTFTYWLSANTTEGHNHYKNSWIRFQLVATNDMGEAIGRTQIYTNEIALSPCMGTFFQ